jgi:hypothetical protein
MTSVSLQPVPSLGTSDLNFIKIIIKVLWRPENFGRHFLDIQVKCK